MIRDCDVVVIGGGPGGLAAGYMAMKSGADKVVLLERDSKVGGILNQCIHCGFGLIRYGEELSGPEYASRVIYETVNSGTEVLTSRHVSRITADKTVVAYSRTGIEEYRAKTIVLATGCRERTRGNISIPGSRPAGVFTAGVVQNLINCKNVMIGKRVVILGSGDIGLIMARRLTLEGARVLAIAEVMPEPAGLARNVSQCVFEYDIPLYTRTTVSKIIGKKKLEAVELSNIDEDFNVIAGSSRRIDCDALVLSVGLIPENEVAQTVGVRLKGDNSVDTDEFLQTSVNGIFSCGNSRHVMDLADYVSEQGELAGRNAMHLIRGEELEVWNESRSNCMKKGFPERNSVTCSICPNGCQIRWDGEKQGFLGNKCSRGKVFAEQERTAPKRIVTTTVKTDNNRYPLIPVRSRTAIDKKMVNEAVKRISDISILDEKNTNGESHLFDISLSDGSKVEIIRE